MKNRALVAVVWMFVILAVIAVVSGINTVQTSAQTTASLPQSLDSLYPPISPGPTFLIGMMDLSRSFSGMVCDLFEDDHVNARSHYQNFKSHYTRVAKLVPEWRSEYPSAIVEDLGGALNSGERGKIMEAIEQVGKICYDCHVRTMAPVQLNYHWGDFSAISITDPITNEDVEFQRLKLPMETNMVGIGLNIEQGQRENAQKQLQEFDKRFQTLRETCVACHESERKYYVDEDITRMIDELKLRLSEATVDAEAVGKLLDNVGQESCFKCHLVHIPSAYAKK